MKKLKELADKIAAEHGLEWYQPLNKAEDSAGMTAIDLGNGYSLHHEHSDNGHDIWAVGFKGERAGTFMLKTEDTRRNKPMVVWAGLEKAHRGKGVGTLAYKALAVHYGGLDSDKASSSDDAIKAWVRAGGRQMKLKTQFGKPRYTLDGDKKNPPIVWNEDLKKTGWGEWQPEDLDDAIQYQTDAYGKKINQNKLQYSHTELMDPDDFENDLSAHTGVNEKGWLKQFPKSEWSERFTEEYGSNLGHIPKLYFSGSMNPGIAINGAFGDGRHRSLFYHAIGENMPVAHFFTNKKYKKNEDLVKGARGDWEKEPEYKLHISDDIHEPQAIVTYKNKKIGGLNTIKTLNGTKVSMVYVDPEHQRKGLATAMYRAIEEKIKTKLIPSDKQTTEGQSLWSQPNRPFGKSAPSHSLHLINKFEGSDFAPTEFHYSVKSNGKEIGRAIVFDKDPRSIHQAGKIGPSLKDIRLHPDYQGQGHSQGIINKLVETHGPLASDSRGNISPTGTKMFHKYGIKQPDESYMLHGQSLKKSSNIDSLIQQAKARIEGVKKVGSQEPRPMIFASKDKKKHAFVTVDPSKKGQWRVTHFVNSKPAGHSEAPTFSHAIKVAHESGYNVFKEIPEEELFKAESLQKDKKPINQFAGGTYEKVLHEGDGFKVVSNYRHNNLYHGSPSPINEFSVSKGSGQFGTGLYLAHDEETGRFHAQGQRQGVAGQRPKSEGHVYQGSFHAPIAVLITDDDEFGKHALDDDNVAEAYRDYGDHLHPRVTKHWGNFVNENYGANAIVFNPSEKNVLTPFTQTLAMNGSKIKMNRLGKSESFVKAEPSADKKIYGKHSSIVYLDPYLIKPQSNDERKGSLTDLHLSGKSPVEWAKGIDLSTPIEATMYANGEVRVSDGHHRQLAAQILHKPIPTNLKLINVKNSILNSQLDSHGKSMSQSDKQNRTNELSQEIEHAKAAPESLAMFTHSFKKSESLIKAAHPSDLKKIANKTNPEANEIVDAAPHAVHAPDQAYVDFLNHPKVQKGLGKGDIGGISAKMVHKVGDDTYMAKPYHKKIESATRAMNPHPISGWSTMATRNLFRAAGIGHLCEDVSFHEHNGVPMTVHKFAKQAYNANAYGWRPDLVKNHIDTQGKQIAIIDFLTNNRDRHAGNVLFKEYEYYNNLLAIDHERNFQYNQNFTENPNSYIKSIGLQYTQQNPNNPSFAGDQATKDWWKSNRDNIINSFNKDIKSIKDPHLKNHIHTNFMKRVGWLDEYSDPDHLDFFDDAAVPVEMFKERRPKTDYKAIMKNLPENPYKAIGVIDGLFSKKLSFATKETLVDLWNEQVDKMSGEEVGNYLKDIQKTKNHPHPKGAYWSLMNRLAEKNHRQGMQHLVQNNMIDLPYWKDNFETVLKNNAIIEKLPNSPSAAINIIDNLFSKKDLPSGVEKNLLNLWNNQIDKMSPEEIGNYYKKGVNKHPHGTRALFDRLLEKNHRQKMQYLVENKLLNNAGPWERILEEALEQP